MTYACYFLWLSGMLLSRAASVRTVTDTLYSLIGIIITYNLPFGFVVFLWGQRTARQDQQTASNPGLFYLQVVLLIPAKQLSAVSVTLILLDAVTHRERNEQIFQTTEALQMCERTEWEQTGDRPVINTFTALVSAWEPLTVFFGEVARVTGELEGNRLSSEADLTLLDCTGARISGCWSLRSDRR